MSGEQISCLRESQRLLGAVPYLIASTTALPGSSNLVSLVPNAKNTWLQTIAIRFIPAQKPARDMQTIPQEQTHDYFASWHFGKEGSGEAAGLGVLQVGELLLPIRELLRRNLSLARRRCPMASSWKKLIAARPLPIPHADKIRATVAYPEEQSAWSGRIIAIPTI